VFVWTTTMPALIVIGPVALNFYKVVLLIALVPALVTCIGSPTIRLGAIELFLFLYCVWAAVCFSYNHGLGNSVEPIGVIFLQTCGAFLLAKAGCRTMAQFKRILRHIMYALTLMLPFVIIENLTEISPIREVFKILFPIGSGVIDKRLELTRVAAGFAHPILFGVFSAFALGAVWFAFKRMRPLFVPLIAYSTFASLSSGALIVLALQILLISWYYLTQFLQGSIPFLRKRWQMLVMVAIAMYISIDILSNRTPFHVATTYLSFNSTSAYNRILIWEHGTANVANNPIFGLGFRDWVRPAWMVSSVDNYWLLRAMRFGLPGVTFLVIALVIYLWSLLRVDLPRGSHAAEVRRGYAISLVAFCLAGGTVDFFGSIDPLFLFFCGMGAWFYAAQAGRPRIKAGQEIPKPHDEAPTDAMPGIAAEELPDEQPTADPGPHSPEPPKRGPTIRTYP